MAPEFPSWGQQLALDQLTDIAEASDGAIDIVQTEPPSSEGGSLFLRLSIETSDYEFQEGGFRFRQREPLLVYVPPRFPIQPPTAYFGHKRFLGRAHVQWGNYLCLYQATDVEWTANDGMFGFFKRLDDWLRDAARNQLDPNDAPLHPPTEYPSSDTKFAVEIDTPELTDGSSFWIGAAKLSDRNKYCYDISEWTDTSNTLPENERFAAVVLLKQSMPMEYPDTINKLISALRERGVPFDLLFSILKLFALYQKEGDPLYFILGAPMRRRQAGEPLRQHLTAWKMDAEHVGALRAIVLKDSGEDTEEAWRLILEWATEARTEWCRVYDSRPEVTFRRDQETNANWFLGKSVALLGCGALGSHIGEYLVRAGVAQLRLVDHSTVNPGIIVRQQFKHYQVGYSKQSALSVQLGLINPKADIDHEFANLTRGWPASLALEEFDLVIDATASRRVATALQLDWSALNSTPPVLRCSISGDASQGIACLKMPRSCFGPSDLVRQTKLVAFHTPELSDFALSFWPQEQQERGFQPEPGCSEPTFVGSAADIAFFSSLFFNFAAHALQGEADDAAKALFVSAPNSNRSMASRVVDLGQTDLSEDAFCGYRVHISSSARKAVESEIRSNARTGSPKDETGGLLLGEIDDSLRTISIDVATGPPPDSTKTPELFLCGVEGTDEQCKYHAEGSGNSTRFVGVWHTHPVSMPEPSNVDLGAMAQILHFQEKTPRHVVMLIVGYAMTRPVWRFHLFRKNQFQIIPIDEVVEPDGR
jgi:integrative and conjugative element protein (TIGR02256 family)